MPLKPAGDWTERDLEALIRDSREESVRLAYHPRHALGKDAADRDALSREISSMANSDGGLAIYGIELRGGVPIHLDPVDSNAFTTGWLEARLESSIEPPIPDLKIQSVKLAHHADRCVYVIEAPRSDAGPHRASDGRFYKRADGRAQVMHAHELRDAVWRQRQPDVRPTLALEPLREFGPAHKSLARLVVRLKNRGSVPAKDVYAEIRVPEPAVSPLTRFPDERRERAEGVDWRVFRHRLRDSAGPLTLFPGSEAAVTDETKTSIALEWTTGTSSKSPLLVRCDVFADGAPPRSASIELPLET